MTVATSSEASWKESAGTEKRLNVQNVLQNIFCSSSRLCHPGTRVPDCYVINWLSSLCVLLIQLTSLDKTSPISGLESAHESRGGGTLFAHAPVR